MKKNTTKKKATGKKTRNSTRIICTILAGLMVLSVVTSIVLYLAS